MSLCNDHYYGHVNRFIVDEKVTWLECAASCMVWSTILVFYLELPYGHLMNEVMGSASARTQVKGNLFSFTMPWEDIERCCHLACVHASEPHQEALNEIRSQLSLPHSEDTLATLVTPDNPWTRPVDNCIRCVFLISFRFDPSTVRFEIAMLLDSQGPFAKALL